MAAISEAISQSLKEVQPPKEQMSLIKKSITAIREVMKLADNIKSAGESLNVLQPPLLRQTGSSPPDESAPQFFI